jgi:glycosyltransferase involved in cell wall biosynthesis
MDESPRITVTLTRYNEPAWLLRQTLESLALQQDALLRLLFLDQLNKDDGLRSYCEDLSSDNLTIEHIAIPARSLSYARNAALERTHTDKLLFIDADAIADPTWARELAATLDRPGVGVAGGRILPLWHRRPLWLARSHVVLDQYSMLDLGGGMRPVNRVVGANFGLNLARIGSLAYFDETLGRREGKLFSGEETELCRRVKDNGGQVLYNGNAIIRHQVLPERIRYGWIFKRMYYSGITRALAGGAPAPSRRLGIWDYLALPVILPAYALGYVHARFQRLRESGQLFRNAGD